MATVEEMFGFAAGVATVAAFASRDMLSLRLAALSANILFITYAFLLGLKPILFLHGILFPINFLRLIDCLRGRALPKLETVIVEAPRQASPNCGGS